MWHSFLWKLFACTISGCTIFLATPTFDLWPLAWVGLVPMFFALKDMTPRRAFFWGWWCGFICNAGGFYWIQLLLIRFGHIHWLPSFFLYLLLVAYQGLLFGVFAYLYRRVKVHKKNLPMTLLAPVLMTALEFIIPFIFPWYIAITQAWVVPVVQIAELTGPLGVTFLVILANGMLFDIANAIAARGPLPRIPVAIGGAVIGATLIFGFLRIGQIEARRQAAPKVKVGIVQANIGITEKGLRRLAPKHLKIHQELSQKLERQGAELIIWPESSYPYAYERSMTQDWPSSSRLRAMRGIHVPLLFGTLTYSRQEKYPYNTALMIEPDGRITGRFDKNYLLMFGEYIPFYEYIPQFKRFFPAASNFARGTTVTTFPFHEYRIAPMICYEDIIPSFGRRLAKLNPHLFVNITNDAWFGKTSEPYEHLALAIYRSVEHRVELLRAVNTGVSVIVDATGRVVKKTQSYDPVITPGVKPVTLYGEVAMLEGGHTVYAYLGDWLGYLCLGALVVFLLLTRRKKAPSPALASRRKKQPRKIKK